MPPRRGRVGIRLSADDPPTVLAVTPGGPAQRAGLRPGDRLDAAARITLSRCRAGLSVTLQVDGTVHELMPEPLPGERWDGITVTYGWLRAYDGQALRVIDLHPPGTCRATVLYAQGHDLGSIERVAGDPGDPLGGLVTALVRAGLAVRRVERRGVGDSAGDDPAETPWETERADLAAALPAGPVVILGHSLGANHAAALAGCDPRVRALALYGAGADRWRDYLAANLRRQLVRAGLDEPHAQAISRAHREFHRRLFDEECEGLVAAAGLDAGLWAWVGLDARGRIHGRTAAYWRAVDREDFTAPLRALGVPSLALWGDRDTVTSREEHGRVAALARGDLGVVAGADHAFADPAGRYHPGVGEALAAWIAQYL